MTHYDEDAPFREPMHKPTFSEPPYNGTERKNRGARRRNRLRLQLARRIQRINDDSPYLESGDRLREMA